MQTSSIYLSVNILYLLHTYSQNSTTLIWFTSHIHTTIEALPFFIHTNTLILPHTLRTPRVCNVTTFTQTRLTCWLLSFIIFFSPQSKYRSACCMCFDLLSFCWISAVLALQSLLKGKELTGKDASLMPPSLLCYSNTPLFLCVIKRKCWIHLSYVD